MFKSYTQIVFLKCIDESLHLFPQQAVLSPLPCKRTTMLIFSDIIDYVLWIIKRFFLKLLRWNRFSSCPENNLRFVRGKQHIVARVVILWCSLDSTSWSFSRCLQMLQKSRTAQHFSQFFSCSFSSRKRFQIKRLLEQKETFKEGNAPNNNYSDK